MKAIRPDLLVTGRGPNAREAHTAGPFVHTPAYFYGPDDPNFGFDDQTCLGGGDWGDFVDDSGSWAAAAWSSPTLM
jgi:hypothetical protein